jgi:hypothetical protein
MNPAREEIPERGETPTDLSSYLTSSSKRKVKVLDTKEIKENKQIVRKQISRLSMPH